LSVIAAGFLWGFSDVWWPATVLLFGPRWVLLLPLSLLIPLALIWDRPLIPMLLLAGLILLGPVMGFRAGPLWAVAESGPEPALTVITFNARGGSTLLRRPLNLLTDWDPDILAIQECGPDLVAELRQDPFWTVDSRSGVCLVSRLSILEVKEMERDALEFAGGSGVVVTYTLDLGGTPIRVTTVHLDTPRAGFELVRSGRLRTGIPKVSEKSFLRGIELKQAAAWTEGVPGAQIVLGDFNTPPESRLFRQAWSPWQNAFSAAGWGLGGTRLNGWIRARIDHILVNDGWKVLAAWVGEDIGSDHLPVFARIQPR
jgi:endonuclease/exonuclease/phosphatase (EEP) superfamily protein YafD